jgi:hypothetical protein
MITEPTTNKEMRKYKAAIFIFLLADAESG